MAIQTALVVDDSRSARYILQRLLERQKIYTDSVSSAHEALSYLREYRPDVVFMDDMMPGMEGQEAIGRLAANPVTANIPIIMYTGRDYHEICAVPLHDNVIGVLSKPFTPQDIDALLDKLDRTLSPPVTAKLIRRPAVVESVPELTLVPVTDASVEWVAAPRHEVTAIPELVMPEIKLAELADSVEPESKPAPTLHSVVSTVVPILAHKLERQVDQTHLVKCVAEAVDEKSAAIQTLLVERAEAAAQRAVGQALQIKQEQLENDLSLSVDAKLSALQTLLVDRVENETRRAVGAALEINHEKFASLVAEAVDSKFAVMQSQLVERTKSDVRHAAEQMIGELFVNGVRPHIQQMEECMRQAMTDLRYELLCSQEQVLDQRIPQLLDALEQRQRQRVDSLQTTLVESMENAAAALCRLSR